jgi:hypothetical protein
MKPDIELLIYAATSAVAGALLMQLISIAVDYPADAGNGLDNIGWCERLQH